MTSPQLPASTLALRRRATKTPRLSSSSCPTPAAFGTCLLTVLLSAALLVPCARAAFPWYDPAMVVVVGGQNPKWSPATSSPELLRANCVEAALEASKAFPGRQVVIGMFWAPSGTVTFAESVPHQEALEKGLREAALILGGPEKVVFMPWSIPRENLLRIRERTGVHAGELTFLYWRYGATRSRAVAEADVGLVLNHRVRNKDGDVWQQRMRELEKAGLVTLELVSHEGGGIPGGERLTNSKGKNIWEDFFSEKTIRAWERVTREHATVMSRYASYAGTAMDEPLMPLNTDGALATSTALADAFQRRYGTPFPGFPTTFDERCGPAFLQLVAMLENPMNRFCERMRDASHRANSSVPFTTLLVGTEYAWAGYNHERPSLDIPGCDPYAFFDHQLTQVALECQLYDDAWGHVQPSAVHIVYPRRAMWKYWRNRHNWEKGETMSWARSFRHITPLVDAISEETAMRSLSRLRGVLVWPIARVTDEQEEQRLLDWVAQGNVLLLSNALCFDRLLHPKPIPEDSILRKFLQPSPPAPDKAPQTVQWHDGEHGAEMQAGCVPIPVQVVAADTTKVLSRVGDGAFGVRFAHGQGAVVLAFGGTQTIDYPANVPVDPYMLWLAEETLKLARVPQAATAAPRKDMLFLNTNGRFLTVYNPAKHTVHLSTAPAAYGIGTPALGFEDALQGTRFTPPDGTDQVAIPFAEGQKLRLLRILTAAKSE